MTITTPEDLLVMQERVKLNMQKVHPIPAEVLEDEPEPDPGPESQLQSKIRDWAKKENYPCHINPQTKKLSWFIAPGDPDVILFLPFSMVAVFETKEKTGRLSQVQKDRAITYSYLGHPIHKVKSFRRFLEIVYSLMKRK